MTAIRIRPLQDGLSFGVRIDGVTRESVRDDSVRGQIVDAFERAGVIVFENVEPSQEMHVAISDVFGPMKPHPVPNTDKVDDDILPGVIDMKHSRDFCNVVEVDGRPLGGWLPWHFDHCYNDELNRAGVLRAITIAPELGLTGFADGAELYATLPADLKAQIEGCEVIYTLDMRYGKMRFGRLPGFRVREEHPGHIDALGFARTLPRAIHPAVWRRPNGDRVLHVSPWMAVGLAGREDEAGDRLLEAVCQHIVSNDSACYWHRWQPTDMLIWDNWRMLHAVSGHDPDTPRRMQRTTIKGDYGLGRFEDNAVGDRIQAEIEV